MVGKQFEVIYDDFSGGHFVGAVGTKQPMNTWVGANVAANQYDGTLMPLETPYTLTDTLTGDTAANCSRPLFLLRSNRVVWAGNTHAYAVAVSTAAPPLAITSVAIGTAVYQYIETESNSASSPCHFKPTSEVLYLTTGTTLLRVNEIASVVNTTVLPITPLGLIAAWGQFVLVANINTVYFSNPGTAATWTGTDFFTVPSRIQGMCVHQNALYVATSGGWFVGTGIFNSTFSLRQITTTDSGWYPLSIDSTVVSTPGQATKLSVDSSFMTNGAVVKELAGIKTRPLNLAIGPDGQPPTLTVDSVLVGEFVVVTCASQGSVTNDDGSTLDLGRTLWVLNTRNGTWYRRVVPSTETVQAVARGLASADLLIYRRSAPTENLMFARLNSPDLIGNQDGTWPTATVTLAEYFHRVPFTIKEVLCEVDYGVQGITALANNRSVAVAVATPGSLLEAEQDFTMSRVKSSTLTQTLPARAQAGTNHSRRRSFVRFNPTDGADTYTASPIVTLSGVKLRRLIMRCTEAS